VVEKKIHSNAKILPIYIYIYIYNLFIYLFIFLYIYFYKGFFWKIYTKVARFISLELKKACGLQIYSKKLDF